MIKNTAIIGMGALGLLFGNQITERLGKDAVSYILDGDRLDSYRGRSFTVNGEEKEFSLVSSAQAQPADLVIAAVKFGSLESALDSMRGCVGEDTIILSVLNGISSERIIGERYGMDRVLCTVAQGMDAMRSGSSLTYTKMGELIIGTFDPAQEPLLAQVREFFDSVGLPYTAAEDIHKRLWGKFMLNVGVNQTCMVYETDYAGVLAPGDAHKTMLAAMHEVAQLAKTEGIDLTEEDIDYYVGLLGTLSPTGVPSMRQDAIARRPSEVEMFAGTVLRMAQQRGMDTPANRFLYDSVIKMEAEY